MDTNSEQEIFLDNKIYEGLFNIFELELEEISRFVALTSANMDVYSNKIHELHLRVCSEIENLLKTVIHKHFVPLEDMKEYWAKEKATLLAEKSLTFQYEELKSQLNSGDKQEVERLLFGFPDFAFYFKLACGNFNLDKKVIKFSGMVSHVIEWEVIQPFQIKKGQNVPLWWSNYNKLKHDKIKNFDLCRLGDLLYALSGLYILMNYLLKYQTDNHPIQNRNYRLEKMTKAIVTFDCSFCSIKSNFFKASNASQDYPISSILPDMLSEIEYQEIRVTDLENRANIRWRDLIEKANTKLVDIDLKSLDYASIHEIRNLHDKMRSSEHSLFYIYLDFEKVMNFQNQSFRELKLLGRFIN